MGSQYPFQLEKKRAASGGLAPTEPALTSLPVCGSELKSKIFQLYGEGAESGDQPHAPQSHPPILTEAISATHILHGRHPSLNLLLYALTPEHTLPPINTLLAGDTKFPAIVSTTTVDPSYSTAAPS